MLTPPALPFGARALNAMGSAVRGIGFPLLTLDADAELSRACKTSGLDDLGDDGGDAVREGLARLIEALEREADLTALGRMMARQEIGRCLVNRLQLVDWRKRHPQVADERIERPIILVGQGRTGTSILHELLALDPANRVPMTWEVELPCPPPEPATYATDARIQEVGQSLDRAESLIPDFKKIHRMGPQLPQECVRFMGYEFASVIFSTTWRIPTYTHWVFEQADMKSVYRAHRRFLQHLQSRKRGDRWVLKTPAHLWHQGDLMAEYPDARLVQTHRDPLKVLSSLTSLEVVLRKMASNDVNTREIAAEWSDYTCLGYERSTDFRASGVLPSAQVIDIQFQRFIHDPISSVREIYAHFDLELTPRVEAAMKTYVESNPDDRDGRHAHRFSETGLDPDEEREKVRRYQTYFDVPSEKIT